MPARTILILVGLLFAAKAIVLLIDPSPRLFMGDSGSYLHAAASSWVPPDRSYVYPLFIRLVAFDTQSLWLLVLAQSLLGVITALLLFRMLAIDLALGARTAAMFAVVFALGPEQLFYERMVMAEAISLFAFACMLGAGFAYLRDGRLAWLPTIALSGILAVSLRISLLPVVLGFALLPVLIRWLQHTPFAARHLAKMLLHAVVVLAATMLAHDGYKAWYDYHYDLRDEYRPGYIANSGPFRLSLVLPLVQAQDFTDLGIAEDVTKRLTEGWNDRHRRETLLWSEDSILARLRHAHGQPIADRIAGKIAMRAVRRDPAGLLRLSAQTLGDYFNPAVAEPRLHDDLGARGMTPAQVDHLKTTFGFDATGLSEKRSLAREYLRVSAPWLTFCLFALVPLALVTLASGWRRARSPSLLLALTSIGLFLGHALFSSIVSYRYLHAFPFLVLLNVGAIAANLRVQRSSMLPPAVRLT